MKRLVNTSVVRVFDSATLRLRWQKNGYGAAIDPSGRRIAIAHNRSSRWAIGIHNARTGRRTHTFSGTRARFTFVGPHRIATNRGNRVVVRELNIGREKYSIGVRGELLALSASDNGCWLAIKDRVTYATYNLHHRASQQPVRYNNETELRVIE